MPRQRGGETAVRSVVGSEWQRLRRQYELAEGFWLGFIFSPSPRTVVELRRQVERMLRSRRPWWMFRHRFQRLMLIQPTSPDELRNMLPRLFDAKAARAGHVWVEAVHVDSALQAATENDPGPWTIAWDWLMMRANERRDALRRHLTGGVVFAVPCEWKSRVRDAAPDLWSVRSLVLDVPGVPDVGGAVRAGWAPNGPDLYTPRPPMSPSGASTDVDFALAEANRIKHARRYRALARAPLLLRAAEGLLARRRSGEAAEVAREAVGLLRSEQRPNNMAPDLLPEALTLEGYAEEAAGNLGIADARFEEAVGLWRVRVAHGKMARSLRDLSGGLDRLGIVRREAGDLFGARAAFEESVAYCRQAVQAMSSTPPLLRDLAAGLARLGEVLWRIGDLGGALTVFEESVVLSRRLVRATPQSRRDLVIGLDGLGRVLAETGNLAKGAAAFEESVAVCRELVAQAETPDTLRALSARLAQLGDITWQGGDLVAAAAAFKESANVLRRLLAQDVTPQTLRELSVVLKRVGGVRRDTGDLVGVVEIALERLRRWLGLWIRIVWNRVTRWSAWLTP